MHPTFGKRKKGRGCLDRSDGNRMDGWYYEKKKEKNVGRWGGVDFLSFSFPSCPTMRFRDPMDPNFQTPHTHTSFFRSVRREGDAQRTSFGSKDGPPNVLVGTRRSVPSGEGAWERRMGIRPRETLVFMGMVRSFRTFEKTRTCGGDRWMDGMDPKGAVAVASRVDLETNSYDQKEDGFEIWFSNGTKV